MTLRPDKGTAGDGRGGTGDESAKGTETNTPQDDNAESVFSTTITTTTNNNVNKVVEGTDDYDTKMSNDDMIVTKSEEPPTDVSAVMELDVGIKVDETVDCKNLSAVDLSRSGKILDDAWSADATSACHEPTTPGGVDTAGSTPMRISRQSSGSNTTSMSTHFEEMLSSVAGNLMKHLRPDPSNFMDDLVESLGTRSTYTPGEAEEDKEERMRLNETQRMLRELTSDSDLMQQVMKAAANPEMAKELARQADTAWRNIEALPGGFRALYQMHRNIQQPLWQAVANGGPTGGSSSSRYGRTTAPKPTQPLNVDPLPNPWATTRHTPSTPLPGAGAFGSLFPGTMGGAGNPLGGLSALMRPTFNAPRHQVPPATASQHFSGLMSTLQPHVGNSGVVVHGPSSPLGTGIGATTATATATPGGALPPTDPSSCKPLVSQADGEAGLDSAMMADKYACELKELADMGMNDRDRCLTALEAADGDLFQALGLLQSLEELDRQESEK